MLGRRALPPCIPGPSFDDPGPSLERRWGDTDVPPQELRAPDIGLMSGARNIGVMSSSVSAEHDPAQVKASGSSSAVKSLNEVLDWLGQSDITDPTYKNLPMDNLGDEPSDEDEPTDEGAPQALANFAHLTYDPRTRPRIQAHSSFVEAMTDSQFRQPVGGRAVGSNDFRNEGLHVPRDMASPPPLPWNIARTRNEAMRFENDSPTLCTAAGVVCQTTENIDEGAWSIEEAEAVEWHQRQQRTGTVGRLVHYNDGDNPKEDLLLRGGTGAHVVVAAVRDGGPASKVGVKAGDRLVSIDGSKAFFSYPADVIRDRLRSPTVLVFLGFVGKLQAEVRLSTSTRICGLNTQQSALSKSDHGQDSHFKIAEERVFSMGSASIFLSTTDAVNDENGYDSTANSQAQDDTMLQSENVATADMSTSRRLLFELQSLEASTIVRRAMMGAPVCDDLQDENGSFRNASRLRAGFGTRTPAASLGGYDHEGGDAAPNFVRSASTGQVIGLSRERFGETLAASPTFPDVSGKMGTTSLPVPPGDGHGITMKPISLRTPGDELSPRQDDEAGAEEDRPRAAISGVNPFPRSGSISPHLDASGASSRRLPVRSFPRDQPSMDVPINSDIHEAFALPYSSAEVAVAEAFGRGGAVETVDAAADRAVDVACADPDFRPVLLSPEESSPEPIRQSENDLNHPNSTQRFRHVLHEGISALGVRDPIEEDVDRAPPIDDSDSGSRGPPPTPPQRSQVTRCEADDYFDPVIA